MSAPDHSPIMVGWVELATEASMLRVIWSRCAWSGYVSGRSVMDEGEGRLTVRLRARRLGSKT